MKRVLWYLTVTGIALAGQSGASGQSGLSDKKTRQMIERAQKARDKYAREKSEVVPTENGDLSPDVVRLREAVFESMSDENAIKAYRKADQVTQIDMYVQAFSTEMAMLAEGRIDPKRPGLLSGIFGQALRRLPFAEYWARLATHAIISITFDTRNANGMAKKAMANAAAVVGMFLGPEKATQYEKGTLTERAVLTTQALQAALKFGWAGRPFALWLCDIKGLDGRRGSAAREALSEMLGADDPRLTDWNNLSPEQQRTAVLEGLGLMLLNAQAALEDATGAAMQRFTARGQLKGGSTEQVIMTAFGKDGLAQYKKASDEEKEAIRRAAVISAVMQQYAFFLLIGAEPVNMVRMASSP